MSKQILPQTGAITADVVDKSNANFTELYNRAYVTPEDFGAIGDGVADDTVALQAALDSGHGLGIPNDKTYLVDQLEIPNNTTIRGFGGIIKGKANMAAGAVLSSGTTTKTNIIIDNVIIDGNRANQTNGVSGMSFGDSSNNIRISNNNIYECKLAGIGLGAHDVRITGNIITNTNANGINAPSTPSHPIYNIDVIRNKITLDDQGTDAGCIEFDDGAYDILIDGNTCIGTDLSEHLIQVEQDCYNAVVVNNRTFKGLYGIYVGTLAGNYDAKTVVANNFTTDAVTCGILVENSQFVTVTGNISELSGNDGIRLSGVNYATVTGNLALNSGQIVADRHGILISGCENSTITGNISIDDQTVPTVKYGIYAVSGTNNSYVGNNAEGSITADFTMVDTTSVAMGNRGATKDYGAVNSYLQTPLWMSSKIVDHKLNLADAAIPTIGDSNLFYTGGTTTITNFTGASFFQPFTIVAVHAMTINNGTIKLTGSANQLMAPDDCITFMRVNSGYIELSRSIK